MTPTDIACALRRERLGLLYGKTSGTEKLAQYIEEYTGD